MKIPKNLPRPLFVRPNDYITVMGVEYIIRRNEFAQMVEVIGRVSRKLPGDKDVLWALESRRKVAQWGSKFFMYEPIDAEIVLSIMQVIWEADKRRGIPIPNITLGKDALYDDD